MKYFLKGQSFQVRSLPLRFSLRSILKYDGRKMCKLEICSFSHHLYLETKGSKSCFIFGWNALRKQIFLRELLICCLFQLAWPFYNSLAFNFFQQILHSHTLTCLTNPPSRRPLDSSKNNSCVSLSHCVIKMIASVIVLTDWRIRVG